MSLQPTERSLAMRKSHRTRTRPAAGFTLLEMGIVIGVAAILAAAVLPDFVEASRNKMAEKAANEVLALQDAARWFYLESGRPGFAVGTPGPRWPGEQNANQCRQFFDTPRAQLELFQAGFVNAPPGQTDVYTNPWRQRYQIDLWQNPASLVNPPPCLLIISTALPEPIADTFASLLPQGTCRPGACPPTVTVPIGYKACCTIIGKPGVEIGLNPCAAGLTPQVGAGNALVCQ